MKCPHCGKELLKIHLRQWSVLLLLEWALCGAWSPNLQLTDSKDEVTCLNCLQSNAFKEYEEDK